MPVACYCFNAGSVRQWGFTHLMPCLKLTHSMRRERGRRGLEVEAFGDEPINLASMLSCPHMVLVRNTTRARHLAAHHHDKGR